VSRGTETPGCEAFEHDPGVLRLGIGGGGEAVDVPAFPEPSDDEGVDAADEEEAIFLCQFLDLIVSSTNVLNFSHIMLKNTFYFIEIFLSSMWPPCTDSWRTSRGSRYKYGAPVSPLLYNGPQLSSEFLI